MDITSVLNYYYIDKEWCCGKTYNTLEWYDTTRPKPTSEELELKYNELLKDKMRIKRNILLKETDFIVLSDYPIINKEEWLQYRKKLRDFPSIWIPEMEFPQKPTIL